MKRKLADIVAWMPGNRTLNRDAPNATARKLAKRNELSVCQCSRAYGTRGIPANTCVKMNRVAGQPRKRPCCPGRLQTRFHQFTTLVADGFREFRSFVRAKSTLGRSSGARAPLGTLQSAKSLDMLTSLYTGDDRTAPRKASLALKVGIFL